MDAHPHLEQNPKKIFATVHRPALLARRNPHKRDGADLDNGGSWNAKSCTAGADTCCRPICTTGSGAFEQDLGIVRNLLQSNSQRTVADDRLGNAGALFQFMDCLQGLFVWFIAGTIYSFGFISSGHAEIMDARAN